MYMLRVIICTPVPGKTPKLSTYEHRRDLHVACVAGGAKDSARQLEDVGELPAGSSNRALIALIEP
jgi:hypothetical protein